jgi:hypothetical protein
MATAMFAEMLENIRRGSFPKPKLYDELQQRKPKDKNYSVSNDAGVCCISYVALLLFTCYPWTLHVSLKCTRSCGKNVYILWVIFVSRKPKWKSEGS